MDLFIWTELLLYLHSINIEELVLVAIVDRYDAAWDLLRRASPSSKKEIRKKDFKIACMLLWTLLGDAAGLHVCMPYRKVVCLRIKGVIRIFLVNDGYLVIITSYK